MWALRIGDPRFNLGTRTFGGRELTFEQFSDLENGLWFEEEMLPERVRFDQRRRTGDPSFFMGSSGIPLVSEPFFEVLAAHETGNAVFKEMPVEQPDGTPLETRYFFVHVRDFKPTVPLPFVESQEPYLLRKVNYFGEEKIRWSIQDDLKVLQSAEAGLDLWMGEHILETWFFSERLGRALKKAKIRRLPLLHLRYSE